MAAEPDSHDLSQLPPGLAAAWQATPRSRRGPKPAYSVEQVVAAAMELADRDGLAAASLPNIAASLGLTTNGLYRYVGSKDELVVLLTEAGFGPPSDMPVGPDWHTATRAWTYAVLERYRTRPWLLDIPLRLADVTPNRLRWTELLLETFSATGMPDHDALECARLVADFARTTAERQRAGTDPDSPRSPARATAVTTFLTPLLTERGYPRLAALASDESPASTRVDFGLNRLLDGIAGLLEPLPR